MYHTPPSLYNLALRVASEKAVRADMFYQSSLKELRSLPNHLLFDCYFMLFSENHLCLLSRELSDVYVMNKLILVPGYRTRLLTMFQSQLDHGGKAKTNIANNLLSHFITLAKGPKKDRHLINIGLRLGSFFNEGGWYSCCKTLMKMTEFLCGRFPRDEFIMNKLLECYQRKLYAEVQFKQLEDARRTFKKTVELLEEMRRLHIHTNLALIYSNFSGLFYMKSDYPQAIMWSQRALQALHPNSHQRIIVEVLRQAAKTCIVKRYFNKAGLLIKQALKLAAKLYDRDGHPRYADTLSDYGFFLLNSDRTEESVRVYKEVLGIRSSVFLKNNLTVALAHEDLAYVLYVQEYSSGSFTAANSHAEAAIRIMDKLIKGEHLLKSSAKRVKALILEEIALDLPGSEVAFLAGNYFRESEELHKEALATSLNTFGEKNLLTAKQYGNLGRLYQSMKRYEEAERMHLAAIAIKEELLGQYDYEVALTVGHLASLYNYQMSRYKDALQLYQRSIAINTGLFGEGYSGLEYDYRGIAHIYIKMNDDENYRLYNQKINHWRSIREEMEPPHLDDEILPLDKILDTFFRMH